MVNRITGFSGMDVESTVKKLMDAERLPLNKLKAQKQITEWQTQQYRDMNLLLDDLRNSLVNGLGLQSSYNAKKVVSSNDAFVTAVSNGTSGNTVNTIDSITSLATSARWSGTKTPAISSSKLLKDTTLGAQGVTGAQTIKFKVTKPGETTATEETIYFDANTETLDQVLAKMNASTKLGVSGFYDQGTGSTVLTNKNTGKGAQIEIVSDSAGLLNKLGFTHPGVDHDSDPGTPDINQYLVGNDGQDASFKLNGLAMTRSSNTFTVGDVTYSLKQTTASPITISTSTDTTKIFDSIKSFVDKYNDVIKKVNDKVSEKRYRDYQPLTDEQREAMTEDQAKKWDEKAQSGLIKSDSILTGVLDKIRSQLSSPVTGLTSAFKVLSDIGITTSANYLDKGKLEINETKLKEAIANDPDGISKLFTATGATTSEQGLATRLKDSLKNAIDTVAKKAGKSFYVASQYTLGKSLTDLESRISKFEDRLSSIEDRYYRQFSAMESAIERSNQQSAYFASTFG
ncbi:flagellar hook-associated protein 2 [Bacillus sp. JJ664]